MKGQIWEKDQTTYIIAGILVVRREHFILLWNHDRMEQIQAKFFIEQLQEQQPVLRSEKHQWTDREMLLFGEELKKLLVHEHASSSTASHDDHRSSPPQLTMSLRNPTTLRAPSQHPSNKRFDIACSLLANLVAFQPFASFNS